MGLLDLIKGQIASAVQNHLPGVLGGASTEGESAVSTVATDQIVAVVEQLGLGTLVQKFRDGGLEETVSSWIGVGANLPISSEQIQRALGSDTMKNLAATIGISADQVSALLSHVLPGAVDAMTPEGHVPEGAPLPSSLNRQANWSIRLHRAVGTVLSWGRLQPASWIWLEPAG